jgi:hypothetical protein
VSTSGSLWDATIYLSTTHEPAASGDDHFFANSSSISLTSLWLTGKELRMLNKPTVYSKEFFAVFDLP